MTTFLASLFKPNLCRFSATFKQKTLGLLQVDECPEALPDLSKHHSVMADLLREDPSIYRELKERDFRSISAEGRLVRGVKELTKGMFDDLDVSKWLLNVFKTCFSGDLFGLD